jgi:predicted NBD/HSP70 family sugar kinase
MVGQGVNQESVRQRNLSAVLTHVHRAGRISRSDLTAATGLNRSTIGALVAELAERGLVVEGEPVARGTPGRPSPSVLPAEGSVAVLAADIGVATSTFAVSGLGGGLLGHVQTDRPAERRTPEATADDLAALVEQAVRDLGGRHILGLGVAVPGIVRREDGLVHIAANLDWHDVPFAELLHERLGADAPIVLLGNDAELGASAEHVRGAGVGVDDLLYLSGGVGVGGGIIARGQPLGGAAGYAGEVGHLVVNPKGHECTCGGQGCLETEVGQRALLRRLGRPSEPERGAIDAVVADAAAGDREVLAALAEVGEWLGRGVASLVNVLNPSRIVLGGFFAEVHPYIVESLRRELDHHAQWPNRSVVTIVTAALGRDAAVHGAAELALTPVLTNPTLVPVRG